MAGGRPLLPPEPFPLTRTARSRRARGARRRGTFPFNASVTLGG
jgi:hypothetical protein